MKLKQISVPIENSHDRTYELTRALGERGINLRALNIVDTGDFGQLRILVSNVTAARQILMQKEIPAHIDDVVAVEVKDQPGQFADLMGILLGTDIKIKYAYACAGVNSGKAVMVFCFSENDQAIQVLNANGVKLLDEKDFGIFEAAS